MIKAILKIVFAAAIITWLLRSGKLDFSLIGESITSGWNWLICIGLIILQDAVSAIRWRLLLKVKSDAELPIGSMIKLTWIGLFFNSVLPGAVTGDLIKLVYARDLDRKLDRTFLVTTALVDRILGLIGLLFLLGVFSLANYSELASYGDKMRNILHFNFLLFAGVLFFLALLFLPERITLPIRDLLGKIPLLGNKIKKTLDQVWLIGGDKLTVFKCLMISVALQFSNVLGFWIVTAPFYGKELSIMQVFTFVPLGQMAVAVPISPAGIGVGHVIFETLFSFVGIPRGASLFNIYFICVVLVNLFGFFPYVLSGKRHDLEEAHQLEEELS
ncbi:MAG: hypothetical protein CME71_10655 [Halobacteriovorax sp.]|nr:hypothetical protein [Halobacteriovorax sp.]